MNEFNELFQNAVAIKSHEMQQQRKVFEKQPLFIKAGLYYLNEFKEQRQQLDTRRELAMDLKEKGNEYFKESNYSKAQHEYEKALSLFLYIENRNPNWKNEGIVDADLTYKDECEGAEDIIIKVLLNLAICYLKEKLLKDAREACTRVLKYEENSKAYFRRAKSRLEDVNANEEDYVEAIKDLENALALQDDALTQKELSKAKLELKKMQRDERLISKQAIERYKQQQQEEESVEEDSESDSDTSSCYSYSENWKKYTFTTLNYEPTFEEDSSITLPEEVIEFGKFIESRGVHLLMAYEKQNKIQEAENYRQTLSQLMQAKCKFERICRSNFKKPLQIKRAQDFGLDLWDPNVQEEFKQLKETNIKDLRKYLKDQKWVLKKSSIQKKVQKLAEKQRGEPEQGKMNLFDYVIIGICISMISIYVYIHLL